jgi:hypothetical protein
MDSSNVWNSVLTPDWRSRNLRELGLINQPWVHVTLLLGEPITLHIAAPATAQGVIAQVDLFGEYDDGVSLPGLKTGWVHLFGRRLPPATRKPRRPVWAFPRHADEDLPRGGVLLVEPWRRYAFLAGCYPFWAQVDWRPGLGASEYASIGGGEFDKGRASDAAYAQIRTTQQALLQLKAIEIRRGKQQGDGAAWTSNHAFLLDLDAAAIAVCAKSGHKIPTAQAMWRHLNIGKTSFYSRVKDATGKRWQDVASDYATGLRYAELNGIGLPDNGE